MRVLRLVLLALFAACAAFGQLIGPVITSISPSRVEAGTTVLFTITGAGFSSASSVYVGAAVSNSTCLSTTQLTTYITFWSAGQYSVTVKNGSGAPSNAVTITVTAPAPTLASVYPTALAASETTKYLTIKGSKFLYEAAVYWNDTQLSTSRSSDTSLTATVPGTLQIPNPAVSITVLNPGNPTPSNALALTVYSNSLITELIPSSAAMGGPDFTLTVAGSGFAPDSVVYFANSPLQTTFVSSSQLKAVVPASAITTPGGYSVFVRGTSPSSGTTTFGVTGVTPSVTSYSPQEWPGYSDPNNWNRLRISITGTGFVTGSALDWGGTLIALSGVSASSSPITVTADIAPGLRAAPGLFQLKVVNPGGEASSAFPFQLYPTFIQLTPASAPQGVPDLTITVTSQSLPNSASVEFVDTTGTVWPLATTYVSSDQLTAVIPAVLLAVKGVAAVQVRASGAVSPRKTFTVVDPPTLLSLSPATAQAGGAQFSLAAQAPQRPLGCVVLWDGSPLQSWDSSDYVGARVPAELIATPKTVSVRLNCYGILSNALTFTVKAPPPVIESRKPDSVIVGDPATTVVLTGRGFDPLSVVRANGSPLPTTYVSPTELRAVVPETLFNKPTGIDITILNPDGTISYTMPLWVTRSITSITPATIKPIAVDVPIQVTGRGFQPGDRIMYGVGTALETTVISSQTLAAILPASAIQAALNAHKYAIEILVGQYDGLSAYSGVVFDTFVLDYISPNSITAGGSPFVLEAHGCGFVAGSIIKWNEVSLQTEYVSTGMVRGSVPESLISAAGSAAISVLNPSGSRTGNVTFYILSPRPTISSMSPYSVYTSDPPTDLTITGTNFVQGSIARWNESAMQTTVVSSTSLVATPPAGVFGKPAYAAITIANPSGATSLSVSFQILAMRIVSTEPSSSPAGGPGFTLTVRGAGFRAGSKVQWNGQDLVTTFVDTEKLEAAVPPSLIAQAGTALIRVTCGTAVTADTGFSIQSVAPVISASAPGQVSAGAPAFSLYLYGSNFLPTSKAYWTSTPLTTTYISSNELFADVPASLVALSQQAIITVKNPTGLTSQEYRLSVVPVLDFLTPDVLPINSPQPILIMKGTGFSQNGAEFFEPATGLLTSLTTATLDSHTLSITIPTTLLQKKRTGSIVVSGWGDDWPGKSFSIVEKTYIASVSPASAVRGAPTLTLYVKTGFTTLKTLRWNGVALQTGIAGSYAYRATAPAELLLTPGKVLIDGIATDGSVAEGVTFEVLDDVAPSVLSVEPPSTYTSRDPLTFAVNGSGFLQGAEVRWNGSALTTTFVSSTRLTAVAPPSLLTYPQTVNISASNPGTAASTSVPLTVIQRPALSSIYPSTAVAGGSSFDLNVYGNAFVEGAEVRWNGARLNTTFMSASTLRAAVPAANVSQPGTATITVVIPVGIEGGNSVSFTIQPRPALQSISPTSATPGGPAFVLTLSGVNFDRYMNVTWTKSTDYRYFSPTYIDATQLSILIPAELIANPGTATIRLFSSSSIQYGSVDFIIGDPPAITSVTPNQIDAAGPAFTLVVRGQGIMAGAKIRWGSSPLETTVVSSTQAQATIPSSFIATAGIYQISVANSNGANSADYTIYVNPVLSSITPASAPKGSEPVKITARGAGFAGNSQIQFSAFGATTALSTVYFDSTTLTTTIPANLLTESTQAEIAVRGPSAATSRTVIFSVGDAPLIQSLSPEAATYGGPAFALTVNGSGFVSGGTVRWNQTPLTTTYINGNQLTAAVPANLIAGEPTGGATVDVLSPSGGASNSYAFHIVPALTSLEPSGATVGAPSFVLTTNGAGFRSGDTIRWNGTELGTSFVSSTKLTATIPASLLTIPITASVTAGAGASISLPLPFPVTAGSAPASSSAGIVNAASYQTSVSPGSAISIFGSNLAISEAKAEGLPLPKTLNGASVLINGSAAPLFYVSPGQVNAQVPFETPLGTASLVAQSDGRSSAPVQFQVVAAAPGVFSIFDTNHAIAQNYPDWSLNSAQNPAAPGQYVTVYLTGVGRVDNPVEAGKPAPSEPLSRALGDVRVKVGGKSAEVPYAGLTPGFVGLAQVNLIVPPDAPAGEQPLEITIGGIASNTTMLSVKAVR